MRALRPDIPHSIGFLSIRLSVCLFLAISLVGCTVPEQVSVFKEPMKARIIKQEGDARAKEGMDPTNHENARTDWKFSFRPEFEFDLIGNEKREKEYWAKIKVKTCKANIDLDVVSYVHEKVPRDVLDHEKGHVEICRRYYERAEDAAFAAAESVIGKEFEGCGHTEKVAITQALNQAGTASGLIYREKTVDQVNSVSYHYDSIVREHRRDKNEGFPPLKEAVDGAFERHEKEATGSEKAKAQDADNQEASSRAR